MEFELFRLTLLEVRQIDGFEAHIGKGERPSRETWLRQVLSDDVAFDHYKIKFHFVPVRNFVHGAAQIIAGKIGRQVITRENLSPDEDFQDTERPTWKASIVLIDPTHHDDGQKLAVARHGPFGDPFRIVESLIEAVNSRPAQPYSISVSPITDPTTFWEFVNAHPGEITSVQFELLAPNMFGQKSDLDAEMRALRDNEKATRAVVTIESKNGLDLNTESIRNAVTYATRGGGGIKASTKGNKAKYNSKSKIKRTKIKIAEKEQKPKSDLIGDFIRVIFKI